MQPGAVGTLAYAFADKDETTANFGLEEFKTDLSRTHSVTVRNDATTPVTFNVTCRPTRRARRTP